MRRQTPEATTAVDLQYPPVTSSRRWPGVRIRLLRRWHCHGTLRRICGRRSCAFSFPDFQFPRFPALGRLPTPFGQSPASRTLSCAAPRSPARHPQAPQVTPMRPRCGPAITPLFRRPGGSPAGQVWAPAVRRRDVGSSGRRGCTPGGGEERQKPRVLGCWRTVTHSC